MENWKKIAGYEDYSVSDSGAVMNTHKGRMLKETLAGGYYVVWLFKGKSGKRFYVHRLVAMAFIPQTGPFVNHKNENKTDNRVCNLEWCDKAYNNSYGTVRERIRKKLGKRVEQISSTGDIVGTFDSIQDAARCTGINYRHIYSVCNNKESYRYTAGGFIWRLAQ